LNIRRPTTDDVDVLKRELIIVQQRMNEMSLEKEQQIERLRNVLLEMYERRFFNEKFNINVLFNY
jgi:hypothetical protein